MQESYIDWLKSDYHPLLGGALESNINGIWFAKQTAKGSPVTFTTGTARGRWVGGDLNPVRSDGEEVYSDNTLFASEVDFVNTLIGQGSPVIMAQSTLCAYLAWLGCGQETVTGGVSAVLELKASKTLTAGEFKLEIEVLKNVYKTAAIKFNATAAEILAAIAAAFPKAWEAKNITAAGGPISGEGTPVTLTFKEELKNQPIPNIKIVEEVGMTGGTVTSTIKTAGVNFTHEAQPNNSGGFYFGVAKSVGKSVVSRAQYNDCRMKSLRIEGSSASKVVKLTPEIISLDPGQILNADPTLKDNGQRPYIFTEAHGALSIDGEVYEGLSAFAIVINWGISETYGDNVLALDIINNTATIAIEGLTLLLDAKGLTRYNQQIYGTSLPATGAKPITGIPALGSYKVVFTRISSQTGLTEQSLEIEIPSVKWDPSLTIPANPAGGAVELSFAGKMRKSESAASPIKIVTSNSTDPAFSA